MDVGRGIDDGGGVDHYVISYLTDMSTIPACSACLCCHPISNVWILIKFGGLTCLVPFSI